MAHTETVTGAEFAEFVGVTGATISNWADEGMPVLERRGRGKAMKIDPSAAIQWRLENGTSPKSERERLARAQADKVELENAKRRSELVEMSYVAQWAMGLITNTNGMLDGLPGRCAAEIVSMTAAEARARLLDETRTIRTGLAEYLEQLANTPPTVEDTGEDGEAAAPKKRQRVGGRKADTAAGERGAGEVSE